MPVCSCFCFLTGEQPHELLHAARLVLRVLLLLLRRRRRHDVRLGFFVVYIVVFSSMIPSTYPSPGLSPRLVLAYQGAVVSWLRAPGLGGGAARGRRLAKNGRGERVCGERRSSLFTAVWLVL